MNYSGLSFITSLLHLISQWSFFEAPLFYLCGVFKIATRFFSPQSVMLSVMRSVIREGGRLQRDGSYNLLSTPSPNGLNCIRVQRGTSDYPVFRQTLIDQQYLPMIGIASTLYPSKEMRYILDAGANIGCVSIQLARAFPGARVIAIEPDPRNFLALKDNVNRNSLTNIITVQAGLWYADEPLSLQRDFRDGDNWSVRVATATQPSGNPIQGITLQSLMAQQHIPHIDILKMDIEGAERYLFQDAHMADIFLSQVTICAIEIHDEHNIREKINAAFTRNQFAFFESGELTVAFRNERSKNVE